MLATHFVGNPPVGAACDVSIDVALSITHYCRALVGLASMSVASGAGSIVRWRQFAI